MDPTRLVALKCDLCKGDPACVKGCPYNALGFEKPENGAYYRRLESALVLGRKELG
jgi:Fe-S-cluster-containing hydrogenase component 2